MIPNFGLLLWLIWKEHERKFFQDVDFNLHQVFTAALRLQLDNSQSRSAVRSSSIPGQRGHQVVLIGWAPPPLWFKCNTDGSVRGDMNMASCGGVCRDSLGQ